MIKHLENVLNSLKNVPLCELIAGHSECIHTFFFKFEVGIMFLKVSYLLDEKYSNTEKT